MGRWQSIERVAPPTVSRAVDKLVELGLVERGSDADDGRVTILAISEVGRQLMDAARQRKNAWLSERLAALKPSERRQLARAVRLLDRLLEGENQSQAQDR